MGALNTVETKLDDVLHKKAPVQLPENGRKLIVQYLPWINLVLGVFALWSAWSLWRWAHLANALIDYANSLSQAFGGAPVVSNRMTVLMWVGIALLAVEGLLFLAAFPGTRDRKKSGWNLLFYAAILNAVYGIVIVFSEYGGAGQLIASLIGSVLGLYFLFQIRDYYTGRRTVAAAAGKNTTA